MEHWWVEMPNRTVSGLGETETGVTEEQSSPGLEGLPPMSATDVVAEIPWGGSRKVWELAGASSRCRAAESDLRGKSGFAEGCVDYCAAHYAVGY
jgi:hypothetical protein